MIEYFHRCLGGISGMEVKMFELMTKMYSEFSEFRKETNVKLDALSNNMLRIEQEHGKKINASLDGYHQVYEKLQEHDQRFDDLENKLQKQDVEIRVIKGAG